MSDQPDERFPESVLYSGRRRETARREPGMRGLIIDALRSGPLTVPEIASALGQPERDVMWWVMGSVRYGYVEPTGDTTTEGYRSYRIAERDDG